MNQCKCIETPMGSHGLEGYILNETYPYEMIPDVIPVYYRVYPSKEFVDYYYEICSASVFNRFFKPIKAKKGQIIKKT